jgi:S-adenosylmethionine:diacylglycerol 3-amino-3-carboxypropyl transferase
MTSLQAPLPHRRKSSPAPFMRMERVSLPGARSGRLIFAQVREDPRVELLALHPGARERAVVIGSGGCTALSLLAAGAGEVHAIDLNRTQNHLVELKALAVARLDRTLAVQFLGGSPLAPRDRRALYGALRLKLTAGARAYWDRHQDDIARGVIEAGVSERFIRLVCATVRHIVHSPDRVRRLLACTSLDEQRALFTAEWDSRRWRWLFALLLNRFVMSRAYDPQFFAHVGRTNFAEHFLRLANHAITEVPVQDNYFLHQMLSGRYPMERADGVPPYLGEHAFSEKGTKPGLLRLVDGGVTDYLRTLPDQSVDAFALSNVCEWLDPGQVLELFSEVERTAMPGARVVYRNFVGWTDLPESCTRLEQDRALGLSLMRCERSVVQSRVVVCHVREAT